MAAPFPTCDPECVILVHQKQKNTKPMQIQKIIGENGVMPKFCGRGACPAAILADNGDVFVQGYIPAVEENTKLAAPSGESFVRMSRSTFEKIARQVLAS
jgi:hypothetical protein